MLIAFEGPDGAGKSTQSKLLEKFLLGRVEVIRTEWNSSELIRPATKKAKKHKLFTPVTYSLFHAADFADRHERIIRPAIDAGHHVIADRYTDTAIARDVARGLTKDWVKSLYSYALEADLTFYIRISAEDASKRKEKKPAWYEAGRDVIRGSDAWESFQMFQRLVIEIYEEIALEKRPNFVIIDGSDTVGAIQRKIRTEYARRATPEFMTAVRGKAHVA